MAALLLGQAGENVGLTGRGAVAPLRGAIMQDGQDELELTTATSADLVQLRRRVVYVEAALAQLLGDREQLREWFSASELAAMALPGLPTTRQEVGQLASAQAWRTKMTMGRGRVRRLYHFETLPPRAFYALIAAVLRAADGRSPTTCETPDVSITASAEHKNVAPSWLLPLIRLMRSDNLSLDAALLRLSDHLSTGVTCPNLRQATTMLSALGLLRETE